MEYPKDEAILSQIRHLPDPEIPVITIEELGILQGARRTGKLAEVWITPTYNGCPAMDMIASDIKKVLREEGIEDVQVHLVLSPAWTTDWIGEEAKKKLEEYGIAPPAHSSQEKAILSGKTIRVIRCPKCKSTHTSLISLFGSTACKALYRCDSCLEPFDHFKCI